MRMEMGFRKHVKKKKEEKKKKPYFSFFWLFLKERKPPLISIFSLFLGWVFVLHTKTLSPFFFLSLCVLIYRERERKRVTLATVCNIMCILVIGLSYFGFLCLYFAAVAVGLRRVLGLFIFFYARITRKLAVHRTVTFGLFRPFLFLPPIFLQFQRFNFDLYVFPLIVFFFFFLISA